MCATPDFSDRDIAILTGPLLLQTAAERLKGYKAALNEAHLKIDPSLILEGNFREQSGYVFGKELLLRRHRPTALFSFNAMMTLGVLKALEEIRLECPKDLAIATFDDLPFSGILHPQLTSVSQPAYEIGYQAAEIAHGKNRGQAEE